MRKQRRKKYKQIGKKRSYKIEQNDEGMENKLILEKRNHASHSFDFSFKTASPMITTFPLSLVLAYKIILGPSLYISTRIVSPGNTCDVNLTSIDFKFMGSF